jgi:hypothetical protein
MTDEEFNTAARELSCKISQFYDDIEDQTLIMCALIPLVSQSVLNVAYARDTSTIEVLNMFTRDLKFTTAKLQTFMEKLRKTEGTAQ